MNKNNSNEGEGTRERPVLEIARQLHDQARRYIVRVFPEGTRFRAECAAFPGMILTGDSADECWGKVYDAIAVLIAAMREDGAIPPEPVASDADLKFEKQVNFRVSDRDRLMIAAASREGGFRSVGEDRKSVV